MATRGQLVLVVGAIAIAALATGISRAGSLTPPGRPEPSMVTLDDIALLAAAAAAGEAASPVPSDFAGPAYAKLIIDGNRIDGEDTVGGEESVIQLFGFTDGFSRRVTIDNRLSFDPLSFSKRIDRTSPALARALYEDLDVKAEFHFFRPHPHGGPDIEYAAIFLTGGQIIERSVDGGFGAGGAGAPVEVFEMRFDEITWKDLPSGESYTALWQ